MMPSMSVSVAMFGSAKVNACRKTEGASLMKSRMPSKYSLRSRDIFGATKAQFWIFRFMAGKIIPQSGQPYEPSQTLLPSTEVF